MLGETVAGRQLVGLGVCFGGLVLVLSSGLGAAGGELRLAGDLMFLVGAFVWAYTNVLVRVLSPRLSPLAATAYGAVICLPALFVLSLTEDGWTRLPVGRAANLARARVHDPDLNRTANCVLLHGHPAAGRGSGSRLQLPGARQRRRFTVLLLGEHLLALQIVGGFLVLGGLWLVSRKRGARAAAPARPAHQEARS